MGEGGEPVLLQGSGMEGLTRMVGRGKAKKMMESCSDGEMEGGAREGKAFGKSLKDMHGQASASRFMESVPGRDMMMKMASMKGAGFSDEFRGGFMESMKNEEMSMDAPMKKGRGKASLGGVYGAGSGLTPGGDGRQVSHSMMMSARMGERGAALGGQDVPFNGIAPVAYGNPPQAPASFARNTVGMGRSGGAKSGGAMCGSEKSGGAMMMEKIAEMEGGAKKKRMPSARNQEISRLMKTKGMSLPEASRHIKEHGM
jgi:hypothetical protein